jgi:hypothetical protein
MYGPLVPSGVRFWLMAFTSEELDEYPLCGAKKKNGDTCRQHAGAGTAHKGIGRCRWHLGNTPAHRQHAVKQEAMRKMATMGVGGDLEVTPGQALQGALNLSANAMAWLTWMVGGIAEDEMLTPESQSLLRLFNDEKDRLARIAQACANAGISERQIKLQEQQTDMMSQLLEAVMDKIQLTAEQRRAVGPAIRESLPALTAGQGIEPASDAGSAEPVAA